MWHAWEERRPKDHLVFTHSYVQFPSLWGDPDPWSMVIGWEPDALFRIVLLVYLLSWSSRFFFWDREFFDGLYPNWQLVIYITRLHYFLRESKYTYLYIYVYNHMIFHMHIYIYISFPRTSLNIPSRGKIIYFGIWFFIPKLEIHGSDPLSGTVWDVCWISGDVWSRGIFWVSPCFWTCSSWLMAWPWANQQWLPVFSSWWTWFFWECVLSEKSVTFKFTKSLGSTIKRGKDTYFFPQANNLKFADRHSKCDLKM